jgi:ABC-type branched-subunit amino acid transport system substrate-binding protein
MLTIKTKVFRVVIFTIFLFVGTINSTAESNDSKETQQQFMVGVIAPLSGVLAEYGLAAKNGIELAEIQHPGLFTHIDFTYEDSQWDAKTAVSAFVNLSRIKKVSLIFNWGNPTTEAVAPLAEREAVPLIGMTLDSKVALGKKYLIRSINPAAEFSKKLAGYLKLKGYRKLGVVMAENTYVQGLYDGLKSSLSEDQSMEVISQHNISETDFRSAILKLKQRKYDAIGIFLISGQVSTFYKQMLQQKVSIPTFGTDFFESTTEIKLANGGMEGAVYPHLGVSPAFETEYVRRYGNDYQIAYAGNAYDMAILIGTVFNNLTGDLTAEQIMSELKSTQSTLVGETGAFRFQSTKDGDSYFQFPVHLKLIEGARFRPLQ